MGTEEMVFLDHLDPRAAVGCRWTVAPPAAASAVQAVPPVLARMQAALGLRGIRAVAAAGAAAPHHPTMNRAKQVFRVRISLVLAAGALAAIVQASAQQMTLAMAVSVATEITVRPALTDRSILSVTDSYLVVF